MHEPVIYSCTGQQIPINILSTCCLEHLINLSLNTPNKFESLVQNTGLGSAANLDLNTGQNCLNAEVHATPKYN